MALGSLILRYPGDHEVGVDSFAIHTLAESILRQGGAVWMLNPLSYFGWYPVSYPAAGPFVLAALGSLAGMEIEGAILLSSLVFGLVGLLGGYLMARGFRPTGSFPLAVAFIYAFAPRFLAFNLWQASTRNVFMALLPFFIWSLLRYYHTRSLRDLLLVLVTLVTLAAAHRLAVLVVIIAAAFLFSVLLLSVYRILKSTRPSLVMRSSRIGLTKWVALGAAVAVGVGFLVGTNVLSEYSAGELANGSNAPVELFNLMVSITRSVGLAAPLAVVGLVYSPSVRSPGIREAFAVVGLVVLIPTLLFRDYTGFYILPFLALFAGYGVLGIWTRVRTRTWLRKGFAVGTAIAILLTSWAILEYEVAHNPPISVAAYSGATYLESHVDGYTVVCNDGVVCSKAGAISGVRILPVAGGSGNDPSPEILIYRFYSDGEIRQGAVRVPIQDLNFNSDSLWVVVGVNPTEDYVRLVQSPMSNLPNSLVARYGPFYYLETSSGWSVFYGDNGETYTSLLAVSLHQGAYAVYADGSETLWWI
jgi:hypothetical protein